MDKTSWDKVKWRLIENHLNFTKEELSLFKANPRNESVLDLGRELQDKRIAIEVVESHGCNNKHRVGDKFIFDVGIQCGGWGKVVVELSMSDKS